MEIKEVGNRKYKEKGFDHYERRCRHCGTKFSYDEVNGLVYTGYWVDCPICNNKLGHTDYNLFITKHYIIKTFIIKDGKPELVATKEKKCIF